MPCQTLSSVFQPFFVKCLVRCIVHVLHTLLVPVVSYIMLKNPASVTCVPNFCIRNAFVTDFTCFFTFPFFYAQLSVVGPPFLHLRLDLGFCLPFGVEKKLLLWVLPFFLLVLPSHLDVKQLFVSGSGWMQCRALPPKFVVLIPHQSDNSQSEFLPVGKCQWHLFFSSSSSQHLREITRNIIEPGDYAVDVINNWVDVASARYRISHEALWCYGFYTSSIFNLEHLID